MHRAGWGAVRVPATAIAPEVLIGRLPPGVLIVGGNDSLLNNDRHRVWPSVWLLRP